MAYLPGIDRNLLKAATAAPFCSKEIRREFWPSHGASITIRAPFINLHKLICASCSIHWRRAFVTTGSQPPI